MTSHSNLKNSYEIPTSGVTVRKDEENFEGVMDIYAYEEKRYYRLCYFQHGFTIQQYVRNGDNPAQTDMETKLTITKYGRDGYWLKTERWNRAIFKKTADSDMGIPTEEGRRRLAKVFEQINEIYESEFPLSSFDLPKYLPDLFGYILKGEAF